MHFLVLVIFVMKSLRNIKRGIDRLYLKGRMKTTFHVVMVGNIIRTMTQNSLAKLEKILKITRVF